jgi:hypothetical protein
MSSNTYKKPKKSRLCPRNEKFSRLLRKKPRRENFFYKDSYLRRFNLETLSPKTKLYQDLNKKSYYDPLLSAKLRSKSEGMKQILPSNLPGWGNKYFMKKILCHKLKRKFQNQNKRDRIKQDLKKKIYLFKSLSEKRDSVDSSAKLGLKSDFKRLVRTPKIPFLKLDEGVPELSLRNVNDLDIEEKGIFKEESNVLSFPKKIKKMDLSKRSILNFLKKKTGKR